MLTKSYKVHFASSALKNASAEDIALSNVIVIGFVGGFVRHDDVRHPEVGFAGLLRERYPSVVHAEVFSNHDGKNAPRVLAGRQPAPS